MRAETAVSCFWGVTGVSSDGVNRVRRRLVDLLVFNSVYWKKSVPSNGVNRVHGLPRQMRHL